MFIELIATFVAGFAGAGLMLALVRLTGGRLPRWLIPVAAGAAMLLATISSEYSWYPRTRAALPDGVVVAQAVENRAFFRPWTFVAPYTNRFVAVDTGAIRTNSEDPALRLADLYFYGRWSPVRAVQMMVDCGQGRRADPMEASDTSTPVWRDVGTTDPIVVAVCTGGA